MSTKKATPVTVGAAMAKKAAAITAQEAVVAQSEKDLKAAHDAVIAAEKALTLAKKAEETATKTHTKAVERLDTLVNGPQPKIVLGEPQDTKKTPAASSNGNGNTASKPGFLRRVGNFFSAADMDQPKQPTTAKK